MAAPPPASERARAKRSLSPVAHPVVSMMIASIFFFRRESFVRIRIRSPRTVQQMHPLFISKISSVELKRFFTSSSSTGRPPQHTAGGQTAAAQQVSGLHGLRARGVES